MNSESHAQAEGADTPVDPTILRNETPTQLRPESPKPRPRTGPIVWGCIILALVAYVGVNAAAPGSIDVGQWAIATVLGLGVLLLGIGIAVALRSARRR